jgi:hypothetical protein
MNDPSKWDISDYFGPTVGAIVVGVGSAMAWFSRSKDKLTTRMEALDTKITEHAQVDANNHLDQTIKLTTVAANQEHIHQRLADIQSEIRQSAAQGAELVNVQMRDVLNEIRKMSKS